MFYNEIPGITAVEYTSYIWVIRYGKLRIATVWYAIPDNNGLLKVLQEADRPAKTFYTAGFAVSGGTRYYPAFMTITGTNLVIKHYTPGSDAAGSSSLRYYAELVYYV